MSIHFRSPWLRSSRVLQPPSDRLVCHAKAKGGASGKGKSSLDGLMKKKKEAEAATGPKEGDERASQAQRCSPDVRGLLFSITNSYYKATGRYLVNDVDLESLPEAIYHSPFVLLAHDRFQDGVTDPQFIYANKAALELWEASWDQLIGMPSRLSAAEDTNIQEDRQKLLDQAATSKSGVISNYQGWRQSLSGKKFKISGVTLFNVLDFGGDKIGQAAVFDQYELEDGTQVKVTASSEAWQAAVVELPPSEEDVMAAERAVEEQGQHVRALKETGLANTDPQVAAAVVELKARKEKVVELKKKIEEALAAAEAAFDD